MPVQKPVTETMQPLYSIISEIGSDSYPDIQLPEDVDLEKLEEAIGGKPFFVTLPIGQPGESRNGNKYTPESVRNLVMQVNELRHEGMWGHLSIWDIGSRYDPPAVRWLAAEVAPDGTAYGKLVPLTEEARRHFLVADATKSKVGTSVFGTDVAENENGDIVYFKLLTIDLANAELVGVPITSAHPVVTSEMVNNQEKKDMSEVQEKLTEKEETEAIKELRGQIKSMRSAVEDRDSIRDILDIAETENVVKAVRALREQYEELAEENSALLESALQSEVKEKVAVESVRPIVSELVKTMKPLTKKALETALEKVLARESVKALLEDKVVEEMGPPSRTAPEDKQENAWRKYVSIPEGEE